MSESSVKSSVKWITVAADYEGQRIDNFLLRTLKGVPKSKIYQILRTGEVRVNKGRAKPNLRLHEGDLVRVPPLRVSPQTGPIAVPDSLRSELNAAILFEDDSIIVIDKPSGLAVHKGSGVHFGIIEALRAERGEDEYLELVHRLDRDTSGCLLLAKSSHALRELQMEFKQGRVQKRYLALVRGHWDFGDHTVDIPLRKNSIRGGERMVIIAADGKEARSRFRPVSMYRRASLLDVDISTGRTHQIRVHAAHLGHPLIGDEKYGDEQCNRTFAADGLRRLFLHAHSLMFRLGGRDLAFSSPLPDALRAVIDILEGGKRRRR